MSLNLKKNTYPLMSLDNNKPPGFDECQYVSDIRYYCTAKS